MSGQRPDDCSDDDWLVFHLQHGEDTGPGCSYLALYLVASLVGVAFLALLVVVAVLVALVAG